MAPDSINITPIARRRNRAGAGWGRLRACQQGEIVFSSNLRDSRNFPVQRPFDFSAGLALATISRRCLRLGVSQSFSLGSRVLSNASISSIASVDDVPHARHVACDRAVEGGDEAQFWNEGRDFAAHEECCGHAVPSGKMRLNGFPAHSPSMWHTWVGSSGADEVSQSQVIQDDPVDKFLNPFLHRDQVVKRTHNHRIVLRF